MKSDSTPISYEEALRKAETLYGNPLDLPDKTTEKAYDITTRYYRLLLKERLSAGRRNLPCYPFV